MHRAREPLHLACAPAHVCRLAHTARGWHTSRPACPMPQLRRLRARFRSGARVRSAAPPPTPRQSWPRLRIAWRPSTPLTSEEAAGHQQWSVHSPSAPLKRPQSINMVLYGGLFFLQGCYAPVPVKQGVTSLASCSSCSVASGCSKACCFSPVHEVNVLRHYLRSQNKSLQMKVV